MRTRFRQSESETDKKGIDAARSAFLPTVALKKTAGKGDPPGSSPRRIRMRSGKRGTLGRSSIVAMFIALSLLAISFFYSCTGKANGKAQSSTGTGGTVKVPEVKSAGADIPYPEKALELPAIEKGNQGILVVYRHTGFGFVDAKGFDTLVYRFQALPGGWLEGAIAYERRLEGEKEILRYDFNYAGDEVIVTESSGGATKEIARMKTVNDVQEMHGTAERILSRGSGGSLVVGSPSGGYIEEYMMPVEGKGRKSLISRSGAVEATGSYGFPDKGRVVYRERSAKDSTGAEELQISVWIDEKSDYRFRTEGVVPINEVYASGLKEFLRGDNDLKNLALIDLVLGKTRNIRPVLAYALSKP
jgi:hypothetical protein